MCNVLVYKGMQGYKMKKQLVGNSDEQESNLEFEKFKSLVLNNKLSIDYTNNEIYKSMQILDNIKEINVGTVFSGIGAIEHALEILQIPHKISFACDNGGILFESIASEQDIVQLDSLHTQQEKTAFVESVYNKARKTNFVKQSYLANYQLSEDDFFHDIRFLGAHINKKVDLLVGGSPCQSFSIAGKRGGFEDTRGTLFFEFARCVKEFQPDVFIYENVKGLINHDGGKTFSTVINTFDELGYKYFYQVLNAKDFGIPQNRQRIFVIGFKNKEVEFEFPKPVELKTKMADFLLGKVENKYYLSETQTNFVRNPAKLKKQYTQINGAVGLCQRACQQYNLHGDFVEDKYYLSNNLLNYVMSEGTKKFKIKPSIDSDIAKALLASMHKMHRASIDNYVTGEGNRIRKLTPRECLRLMGFCDTFEQKVSDMQMYKQAGNSIVVDVLMALMCSIVNTKVFAK